MHLPQGFRYAGVSCGIKRSSKLDLALVVSDRPAVAAGVYTQNRVVSPSVTLNRTRTPGADMRVVAINSGNANACTGERGWNDARQMARWAAHAVGVSEEQALVMSTGLIGAFLPMDKIESGIRSAALELGSGEESFLAAAHGMLTTDTVHKVATRKLTLGGRNHALAGMAKGGGMIGPNMATMLSVIATDVALEVPVAQELLRESTDQTFNCISVEGHMSTNDTVLLLANGAGGGTALAGADRKQFESALLDLCIELAKSIPADGEGATHLVTIDVTGCATRAAARQIARTVADSALVKTAIAGADPNWGRIVSAAGYAGVDFAPNAMGLSINGFPLYKAGAPVHFDEAEVSASMRQNRDTHIELSFGEGAADVRFWTTDLTVEYVRFNSDYHT